MLGVLYALMQHDLKRLLAYPQHREHRHHPAGSWRWNDGSGLRPGASSPGISVRREPCTTSLNHAVFKGLLFLGAGDVVMTTGTRQIEQFGGLLSADAVDRGCSFFIGAMAISGLPPLNGFASEWLTFQAFLFGFGDLREPFVHFLLRPPGGRVFVKAFASVSLRHDGGSGLRHARPPPSCRAAGAAGGAVCRAVPPGVVLRALGRALYVVALQRPAGAAWVRGWRPAGRAPSPPPLASRRSAARMGARRRARRADGRRPSCRCGCGELSAETRTAMAFS